MESAAQSIQRLVTAVETLVAEEEVLFRAGEFQEAVATQDKLQPLVDRISELARTPALMGRLDAALRKRAGEIILRRQQSAEFLAVRLAEVRAQLHLISVAQHRTSRLKPVYGRPDGEPGVGALVASA